MIFVVLNPEKIWQAIDVKFSQDFTHQKLKSVNFWQSYLKNNKVDVFLGHSVVMCEHCMIWRFRDC